MALKRIKIDRSIKVRILNELLNISDNEKPHVYILKDDDDIVYVGSSINVKSRLGTHLSQGLKYFNSFEIKSCLLEDMVIEERKLIEEFLPKYNKNFKMAKGERFTIIIKKKLKQELEEVALQEQTTISELAREAIENKVKRLLKKDK